MYNNIENNWLGYFEELHKQLNNLLGQLKKFPACSQKMHEEKQIVIRNRKAMGCTNRCNPFKVEHSVAISMESIERD